MNRSWAALLALVSLVLPGVGHALAGAARRALVIALVALAAQGLFLLVQGVAAPGPVLLAATMAGLIAGVLACLWVGVDAWHAARAAPAGRTGQRAAVAALVLAPSVAMVLLPGDPITWRSYSTPSGSMIPTLEIGDRFIVQEGWYGANPVRRGEVVVFTLPGGTAFVKRIVGLAGDRVRMVRGRLVLNGAEVAVEPGPEQHREVWALPQGPRVEVLRRPGPASAADTAEFHVPPDHVFVMGDNVENSADSRFDPRMRYVPVAALVGRATIIYWPWTGGRFGRVIR